MTLAELRTETFRRLEESSTSPVFFSTSDVDAALNAGYLEFSDATEWNEVWRTIDLLHTRPYYDVRTVFDVEVLSVGPAFHTDTNRWLIPSAHQDLDNVFSRWERVRGVPQRVFTRGLFWVGYWPIIGSETGTVKQYATALPAILVEDTDEPGCATVFHQAFIEYAVADLLPQAGEVSAALEAWGRYEQLEHAYNGTVQTRGAVPEPQGMGRA